MQHRVIQPTYRTRKTIRLAALCAAVLPPFLLTTDCSEDREARKIGGPSMLISDGAHGAGTAGFFFLPPLLSQPAVSGTFDSDIATLNPQVAICDITNQTDTDCGGTSAGATTAVAGFSTTTTPPTKLSSTPPH